MKEELYLKSKDDYTEIIQMYIYVLEKNLEFPC